MNVLRFLIAVAFFLILALLLWVFWPASKPAQHVEMPSPKPAGQAQPVASSSAKKDAQGRLLPVNPNATRESKEPDPSAVKRVMEAYLAPISFYGKVVDESGAPIAGASIKLMPNDKPWGNGSVYQETSDRSGLFSLLGARGAALSINVSKDGYYSTAASKGHFVYGGVRGGDEPNNPTPDKPAIFVLKKMGDTEPLVHVPLKTIRVPKNGQPIDISLVKGTTVLKGQGDLVVECWTYNEGLDPNLNQHYSWRSRLTIPAGGLIERRGEFDFEAPAEGYDSLFEVDMPATDAGWGKGFGRQFFAKLRDGRFARLNIELTTGGDHFIVLESFLNPVPGSRNLEYDPLQNVAKPATATTKP